jgi:hypothetical protein
VRPTSPATLGGEFAADHDADEMTDLVLGLTRAASRSDPSAGTSHRTSQRIATHDCARRGPRPPGRHDSVRSGGRSDALVPAPGAVSSSRSFGPERTTTRSSSADDTELPLADGGAAGAAAGGCRRRSLGVCGCQPAPSALSLSHGPPRGSCPRTAPPVGAGRGDTTADRPLRISSGPCARGRRDDDGAGGISERHEQIAALPPLSQKGRARPCRRRLSRSCGA